MGIVKTLKTSELIEKYPPIFGDWITWEDAVEQFYRDEPEAMEALYKSYLASGGFRHPIWIAPYEDVDGSHAYIANGARRIAVALKNHIEDLPVEFENTTSHKKNYFETFIEITSKASDQEIEDFSSTVDSKIRSWELNENVWLNVEILEGLGRAILVVWTVPVEETTAEEISVGVTKRLSKIYPNLVFSVFTKVVERA